jgi:hypothetical protein
MACLATVVTYDCKMLDLQNTLPFYTESLIFTVKASGKK